MKKLLLLIAIIFSFRVSAQQYYPMLDSVNVWTYTGNEPGVITHNVPDDICSYPFACHTQGSMYTTSDTVINSIVYKILLAESDWNPTCEYGYIREDTANRKIYFLDVLGNSEIVLYDFSMQVGNNIDISFYNPGYFVSGTYTLDSINNINILAGIRRVFYLSGPGSYPLIWIEGIGNLGDVIYPYSANYYGSLFMGACWGYPHDFINFVTCFEHNEKIYYDSCARAWAQSIWCFAYFDTCNYYNQCGGINELSSSSFNISPNPTNNNFTITSKYGLLTSALKIYNALGEKVYSEAIHRNRQTVNCRLPVGVYFARIEDGEKSYVQKLIIN